MSGTEIKAFTRGTERLVSPAQTVERVLPLAKSMGITRVADVTGLDHVGIPVVMVVRPNARSLAVSQGKGLSLDAAKASGLMESIELWHAEHILAPLKLGSQREMERHHALVDLAGLPRLSVSTFHPHRRLLWIEGRDLLRGEPAWLPFEMVHADYTRPLPTGSGCFLSTTTGLASGNHPLEATLHALYEVVERDAAALWHAGGPEARARTRVSLDSVDSPLCLGVLDRYQRAGIAVGVWEATSDIGLPVFVAEIADREAHAGRVLYAAGGQGCHRSREIALLRALTEAAQSRLTLISGGRDDSGRDSYEAARVPDGIARKVRELQTLPASPRLFSSAPDARGESFEEDLQAVLAALRGAGLHEAALVDLTRPELGIDVVRAVVPGLESMWDAPGYRPGTRAQRAHEAQMAQMPQQEPR